MNHITVDQLASLDRPVVIDVRERDEFATAHAPAAVNLPLSELQNRVGEIPLDAPVHVICQAGGRSVRATEFLAQNGIDAIDVAGGTNAWIQSGYPTESEQA